MKVGFFTNNYLPRRTGVAHSIVNFKKGLQDKGHKVYVFAPQYEKNSGKQEKDVYRYPSLKMGANISSFEDTFLHSVPFPFSGRLREEVRDLNLDLLHSHHPFLLGAEARRIAEKEDLPLVFSLHTPYHQYLDKLPKGVQDPLKEVVLSKVIAYIDKSDLLVMPTKEAAKPLLEKGFDIDLRVVPAGVRIGEFSRPERSQARKRIFQKYNFDEGTKLLLSVSRLTYEKNVSFLLKSFKQLKKELSQARLLIVGSGQGEKRLRRLAKSLGISKQVVFAGEKPHRELPYFYKSADLFVFASLVETQGLVLIEAMAAGLPCVALKTALGSREVIKDEKTGFLVSEDPQVFARKSLRIFTEKDLRERFQKAAKKEAQSYSVEASAEKLLQAYRSLV